MNETVNADPRTDTKQGDNTTLRMTKTIRASRQKVFKAWSDPAWVARWFAPGDMTVPSAEVDAQVGGNYRIQLKNGEGQTFITTGSYQEIIPNKKLVFTWGWEGPDRHESLVTITLSDSDEGTELTLLHERLENAESVEKHTQGWTGCLANLAGRINQLK